MNMFSKPGREELKAFALVAMQTGVAFVLIYGAAGWWALHAPYRFRFWMPWELSLPFVPWMILVYNSIHLLFLVPLFVMPAAQISRLGRSMLLATVIAGIIFLAFPAPAGFIRPEQVPGWDDWYKALYAVDGSGNTLPSLHITYSWLVVGALTRYRPLLRPYLYFWMMAIMLSVVLIRQHHAADILAGVGLATFLLSRDTNDNQGGAENRVWRFGRDQWNRFGF